MLAKYKSLLHSSDWRLQAGRRQLARLHKLLASMLVECERLRGEIELQSQLAETDGLDGAAIDRQQLFSWLRKSAAAKRRTQELRLELRQQQELSGDRRQQVDAQSVLCRQLERKCGKYEDLVQAERKQVRLRQLNFEESEIEERVSWSK